MQNKEEFLAKMDNTTFARDKEDDNQAIQFEEVAGSIDIILPKRVLLNDNIVLSQWPTNLCVAFGTTAGVNEGRHVLGFKPDKNPNTLAGYIRTNLDPDIDKKGTRIINGPKGARKLAWIEAYTQVNTLLDIKRSIAFGMPIASGTNKLSWVATSKNNNIATIWKGGGHFINIPAYDDEIVLTRPDGGTYTGALIIENTWGKKWGDNGYYYLPYEYAMEVLFITKKSLIINKEEGRKYMLDILENIRKKLEENKITPVINKFPYFDGEQLAILDQENKDLFIVLQRIIKETWYKPIFRTIIGSNEDRTNTRLLLEINNARNYGNRNT